MDLKVHINGEVMDEDYPTPDMVTIFHNLHGASYFGKIDISDAYYQIELDKDAKQICTMNTSQGLFKMCRLPQGLKNSSSIFQNSIESTLKRIKGVVIFQDDIPVYGTTKDQYEKRMLADNECLQTSYVKKFHHQLKEIQLKTSFKRKFSLLLCFQRRNSTRS